MLECLPSLQITNCARSYLVEVQLIVLKESTAYYRIGQQHVHPDVLTWVEYGLSTRPGCGRVSLHEGRMKVEFENIASVGVENRKGRRIERPGNLDLVMNGGSMCLLY